ncbi:MAG: DUF3536 domain-containing protein [Microcoleaceae cyanobacterium]
MVSTSDFSSGTEDNSIPKGVAHSENSLSQGDPRQTATGVYITLHGHFYQPPRENPNLGIIERQPSAAPYQNWNERIHHECYRPNAFARILNPQGNIMGIINNYEFLSFNIGPTLMSWLEQYDMEVYQKILEADRNSSERLNGHGNAIAQVYNHIIMPLANERDKYTQIRWGKADFKSRFGRDPEGIWLAETAIDYPTVEALINEGIRFTILAPSQALRCRPLATPQTPNPEWLEVGSGQIDPTRPYRCYLKNEAGERDESRYLDIFFYDGPISGDMGFSDVLSHSTHLVGRLEGAVQADDRPSQVLGVATDGETFGHHRGGTEKCLAYCFAAEFPSRGWTVSNFAHYLSLAEPSWEVELKPVTAWSCSHGVDRWQDDCGCASGGGWHQKWRRPLRDSLNWLRDQLIPIYEDYGHQFFVDPWVARDDYIQVILDRYPTCLDEFFSRHQTHELTETERTDALRLLEMQRHTLLMYTSCGWFFEELSRPEGTQILRYASRAMELAGDVAGIQLEAKFIQRIAKADSNVDLFKTGDEVYRQLVQTAQVSLEQVAAHYALNSLYTSYPREQRVYCYNAQQQDYQMRQMGRLTLAIGQLLLISEITQEKMQYNFAVLHLGGWDFHCCIQPFSGRRNYTELKQHLFSVLEQASAAQIIRAMADSFGERFYGLQDLFVEERQRLMGLLTQQTLTRLDQLYTQVYRENYGMMMAFHRDQMPVPQELQVAAEVALSHRCLTTVRSLEAESSNGYISLNYLSNLEAIATEAQQMRCPMKNPEIPQSLERLMIRSVRLLLHELNPNQIESVVSCLERLVTVADLLQCHLNLNPAQELYLEHFSSHIAPICLSWLHYQHQIETDENFEISSQSTSVAVDTKSPIHWELPQIRKLLQLGQLLSMDVQEWLDHL